MEPLELLWEGGEHPFDLKLGALRALQEKCDAGPGEVLARLVNGNWRVNDIPETLRLGLMGGGMPADEARRLVDTTLDQHRIGAMAPYALAVLGHALYGPGDDQPGKDQGEAESPGNGASPKSSEPQQ